VIRRARQYRPVAHGDGDDQCQFARSARAKHGAPASARHDLITSQYRFNRHIPTRCRYQRSRDKAGIKAVGRGVVRLRVPVRHLVLELGEHPVVVDAVLLV
jgi:hypothetical protein